MFKPRRTRFHGSHYGVAGLTILLLLTVARPLVAAAFQSAGGYSGDDEYDPAAGGRPELSPAVTFRQSSIRTGGSFSGDDDYDPAAGTRPLLSAVALIAGVASPAGCGLSTDEIAERRAMTIAGGYSGDDDYDPAAGGTPELSLLAFANTPSLKAACEIVISGN